MPSLYQDTAWLKSLQAGAIKAFENGHWQTLKYLLSQIERIEKRVDGYAKV